MKKTIAIFATLALVFSLSSFAYSGPVSENETVKAIFKTDFAEAASVSWTEKNDLYFADFTVNGTAMGAVYDANGKLIASSKIITPAEVPANLLKRAEGNYRSGHSAPRVLEITIDGQKLYYFNIITDKFLIECHADTDGVITEESRLKLQK